MEKLNTNNGMTEINEDELENVSGGKSSAGYISYVCVNPRCSMYMRYLQFEPEKGKCSECGETIRGKV